LCLAALTGDTASRTSLPGGDDDSFVDDGTSSRWGAVLLHSLFAIVIPSSAVTFSALMLMVVRLEEHPVCKKCLH